MTQSNAPGSRRTLNIGIVAGEKSGDALGAGLISALRAIEPNAVFSGLGGPAMLAQGFVSLAPMDRLSVMGLFEPLARLPELVRIRRQLYHHFLASRVDVMVGIDSPDFNLGLEKKLKLQGLRTCHYVCPSVWAWRQGRVKKIRAAADHVLALLPFEADFLRKHDVATTFVGHPLADRINATAGVDDMHGAAIGAQGGASHTLIQEPPARYVCLMPGSRRSEVDALLELFLHAAQLCQADIPGLRFVLPAASPALYQAIMSVLAAPGFAQLASCVEVRRCFARDEAHACLRQAEVVLLASGTATLEAALLGVPMVVAYRMSRAGYALASRLVKVEHFALPNLLLDEAVVPELIQHEANPPQLAAAVLELLHNPAKRQQIKQKFTALGKELARGADQRAASAVLSLCLAAEDSQSQAGRPGAH